MIGGWGNKGGTSASGEQSWRSLQHNSGRRVRSSKARKRRLLSILRAFFLALLFVVAVAAVAWGVLWLVRQEGDHALKAQSEPIARVLFETDGVLPESWLGRRLGLKAGTRMMDVDIFELKQRLEREGQVKRASIERRFPSDLAVTIEEHRPCMRLAMQTRDGRTRYRIVSSEGVVYDGAGYSTNTLKALPFLDPYRYPDGRLFPLRGIDRVAELLELTRIERPAMFRTWRVVSLRNYSGLENFPGQVIEIRSTRVSRIVFSGNKDFALQLDRLAYVLEHLKELGNPSVDTIDLSLRNAAVVQPKSGQLQAY